MPKTLLQLARESFFQPRIAAPSLIGLNLSRSTIFQAALLLSILTVLSQYLLFTFIQTQAIDVWTVSFSSPLGDVVLQMASAYIASVCVILLARGVKVQITFSDAITVYLWFNFLLIILLFLAIASSFVIGTGGVIFVLFTIFWAPYTLAVFWARLLDTKNLFLGFVVAAVAFLIASAISVIVASIIGLPLMEIIPNV